MTGSVDRIENGFAVVETENDFKNIPLNELPQGTKEGSIIELLANGKYRLLPDEEEKIRKQNFDIQQGLFKN